MKKLACLLLAAVLLLTGCAKTSSDGAVSEKKAVEQLSQNFTSTAHIKYKDVEASAEVEKGAGKCKITFTAPENLNGMAFSLSADQVGVSYRGFELDIDPSSAVGGAVMKLLVKAIDKAAAQNGVEIGTEKDAVTIRSDNDQFQFALRLDKTNGNILNLSIPDEELAIDFENFSFFS